MIVTPAQFAAFKRQQAARDRLLAGVCRDLARQTLWLRERLIELHQRVKAVDHVTPQDVPPWPKITIPPELHDLIPPEE